jgi:glycosyltransferase involved in cell wall biosynthesis
MDFRSYSDQCSSVDVFMDAGPDKPLVSIITPSLDQCEFITDALESVMNQDYPYLEHIVVDGGSSDGTLSVLADYAGRYDLHWRSEPDRGHAQAVNKGLKSARGEIIGWVNSDDALFDQRVVSDVVEFFAAKPEADLVYGDIVFIARDSTLSLVRCVPRRFSYQRLLRGCFISQPAVFFRRAVGERYLLDENVKYAVDYDYWLRIAKDYSFVHIDRILAADRYHAQRRMLTGKEFILEEARRIQRSYGLVPGFRSMALNKLDHFITGPLRRLLGLFKLFILFQQQDFAFPLQVQSPWKVVLRQICPWGGYEKLVNAEVKKDLSVK